jgi:hypothetical protein
MAWDSGPVYADVGLAGTSTGGARHGGGQDVEALEVGVTGHGAVVDGRNDLLNAASLRVVNRLTRSIQRSPGAVCVRSEHWASANAFERVTILAISAALKTGWAKGVTPGRDTAVSPLPPLSLPLSMFVVLLASPML